MSSAFFLFVKAGAMSTARIAVMLITTRSSKSVKALRVVVTRQS
jgi:hypothetical protein